ncbi:MAG: 2-succinyl-5-enolpyruvyl-6-hydroxy-3-cyclohexene-1-carboxylic-acid synthase [Cyclobacteriaceae bacterium]|nr:2-succinyl-5-enolpyruvyl-6-hydroxy-3-cyclohexene-1-carboxylic-acid synthase [Cyclobacteriaceae bacterium HetDA_MAG_MS6]
MIDQVVFDTSVICHQLGVEVAVFSPGSRNAPLSISFSRNQNITTYVILDERSAAFVALGIAQHTNRPVVLCCTSGSAVLNYLPAIAEAYFQEIPLIVLSADRPPEWIGQRDGQTINQQDVLAKHVKHSCQLPCDLSHADARWEYSRKLIEAIGLATSGRNGPVHINIPFREPFYPEKDQDLKFTKNIKGPFPSKTDSIITADTQQLLLQKLSRSKKCLLVMGQQHASIAVKKALAQIIASKHLVVVGDIVSNINGIQGAVSHHDLFLANQENWQELSPDLILTTGKSTVSKHLKKFLRISKAEQIHFDPAHVYTDPYQSLPTVIPIDFLEFIPLLAKAEGFNSDYKQQWQKLSDATGVSLTESLKAQPFGEFVAMSQVMKVLPDDIDAHLANSMPVRYVNILGSEKESIRFFANRGTSGIDGSNSTAVGHAISTDRLTLLISGDLSFLYDRNAFFHRYMPANLRVIVFNNFGGGIFNLIPGPANLPKSELELHFTTPHFKDLKLTAEDSGFFYTNCTDHTTLELALNSFFEQSEKPKLLEIQTDQHTDQSVFNYIKQQVNDKQI